MQIRGRRLFEETVRGSDAKNQTKHHKSQADKGEALIAKRPNSSSAAPFRPDARLDKRLLSGEDFQNDSHNV